VSHFDKPALLAKLRRDIEDVERAIYEQGRYDADWAKELKVRLEELKAEYAALKASMEGLGATWDDAPRLQPDEFRSRRIAAFQRIWSQCKRDMTEFQVHMAAFETAVGLQADLGGFSLRLKDIAQVKTGAPNPDFWLQRRGTEDNVGRPTRDGEFSKYNIGITVMLTDIVVPDYLYYWFEMLWMKGYWKTYNYGTLPLRHIRAGDVCALKVTFRS
jgi:hypothetical protein